MSKDRKRIEYKCFTVRRIIWLCQRKQTCFGVITMSGSSRKPKYCLRNKKMFFFVKKLVSQHFPTYLRNFDLSLVFDNVHVFFVCFLPLCQVSICCCCCCCCCCCEYETNSFSLLILRKIIVTCKKTCDFSQLF